MVVVLARQTVDPHLVYQGVGTYDVVALLWVLLVHLEPPRGLTSPRQTHYHDDLQQATMQDISYEMSQQLISLGIFLYAKFTTTICYICFVKLD